LACLKASRMKTRSSSLSSTKRMVCCSFINHQTVGVLMEAAIINGKR